MNLNAKIYDTTLFQASSSSSYLTFRKITTTSQKKIRKLFNFSGKLKVLGKVLLWAKNEYYVMKSIEKCRERTKKNLIWPNCFNCIRWTCAFFWINQTTDGILTQILLLNKYIVHFFATQIMYVMCACQFFNNVIKFGLQRWQSARTLQIESVVNSIRIYYFTNGKKKNHMNFMSFTLVSRHIIHLSTSSCDRFNIKMCQPTWLSTKADGWIDGWVAETQAFNTMNYLMSICVFDAVNQIIHIRCDYFLGLCSPSLPRSSSHLYTNHSWCWCYYDRRKKYFLISGQVGL